MADFLSSGGDEIDFDAAASQFPDIDLDGDIPAIPSLPTATHSTSDFFLDEFEAPRETVVKVTGDDEIEKFSSEFPDIEIPTSPPVQQFGQQQPTFGAPRPQPSVYSSTPILTQELVEDEPQVIKDWREKQAAEIKARDEASKERRQETITKAEKAIDAFYDEYAKKKERAIRDNKDSERNFLESLTNSLSTGTTWQRICDFVELENSQSKTIARAGPGTTDLTRFKEVLLRLKREGDAAPGAGGY
ncbi:clathrin light chain-domain-containing protein [Mycena albidolilacea]|uniref:Clathrin light chain n=1 Tax=Mycena albidolilacea TaxID=1033008 RepID=A0AAD7A6K0_9AGAR|nr:clathrin light chain-domain-containing protein [Mycena albidolilacea]